MERLGPNSVDMTEQELENAFCQLALGFRCDQYTLDQRLQAEEHARNHAEENLKLEVKRGQDLLESLKGMCLDVKRTNVIQSLELCLSIIRGTIERIVSTAEALGAVHQESKVRHGVQLMVAHVESLRRRHERDTVELEEIKKQMLKSFRTRQASELWEEVDTVPKTEKDPHQVQHPLRRRISAAIILKQDQRTERGTESNPYSSEEATDTKSLTQMHMTDLRRSSEIKSDHENDHQLHDGRVLSMLPQPRVKSKSTLEMDSSWPKRTQHSLNVCNTFITGLQRPLMHWICHCRWIIIAIYLIVLCSILMLAILVWFLRAPVLWL
ncbi:inositol 1,4,5-triphosphate receptor associated 2 [Hoplias malabaricus]|uniref:inositol 1,4,5-triphosphate receptor associated 2 n=1 Tax=Hoplias malabaricus TaxID=27720 RepID=UPI0034636C1F